MSEHDVVEQERTGLSFRVDDLDISEDTPWPDPSDRLGRCDEIVKLTPIVRHTEAPLVLSIDAPWGGGKTTFIKLWKTYLKQGDKPEVSLYLNAWESDYAEDPLLPLLSCLDEWLAEEEDSSSNAGKAWRKAKEYLPAVAKSAAGVAAKVVTLGALDLDRDLEKILADAAGNSAGKLIEDFNLKKTDLKNFKTKLSEAIGALPEWQKNLVIFVDELDRCRPIFAIELLERIKHLFDLGRIVFVIAVNREQFARSIQGVYGHEFDGLGYLERFFDLEYRLSSPDRDGYAKALLSNEGMDKYFSSRRYGSHDEEYMKGAVGWLSERFAYEPRDIKKIIARLRLILHSIPENRDIDIEILIVMLFLRKENEELYKKYLNDSSYVNEIADFLLDGSIESISKLTNPAMFSITIGSLIALEDNQVEQKMLLKYWSDLAEKAEENNRWVIEVSRLVDIVRRSTNSRTLQEIRKQAFERVELVCKLNIF